MIGIADVEKIADLAKIAINDEQKNEAAKSLAGILEYVDALTKVDTTSVKPSAYMSAACDVLRDDKVGIQFSQKDALVNAPAAKKGHFAIPKVINQ